jgi:hypothetical protein
MRRWPATAIPSFWFEKAKDLVCEERDPLLFRDLGVPRSTEAVRGVFLSRSTDVGEPCPRARCMQKDSFHDE